MSMFIPEALQEQTPQAPPLPQVSQPPTPPIPQASNVGGGTMDVLKQIAQSPGLIRLIAAMGPERFRGYHYKQVDEEMQSAALKDFMQELIPAVEKGEPVDFQTLFQKAGRYQLSGPQALQVYTKLQEIQAQKDQLRRATVQADWQKGKDIHGMLAEDERLKDARENRLRQEAEGVTKKGDESAMTLYDNIKEREPDASGMVQISPEEANKLRSSNKTTSLIRYKGDNAYVYVKKARELKETMTTVYNTKTKGYQRVSDEQMNTAPPGLYEPMTAGIALNKPPSAEEQGYNDFYMALRAEGIPDEQIAPFWDWKNRDKAKEEIFATHGTSKLPSIQKTIVTTSMNKKLDALQSWLSKKESLLSGKRSHSSAGIEAIQDRIFGELMIPEEVAGYQVKAFIRDSQKQGYSAQQIVDSLRKSLGVPKQ